MAITRQQKEALLQELIDKFSRSKSVVFADYRGLDVAGISNLRGKLREGEAEMKVAKKTLMSLAAKEQDLELDPSVMEGPVAATFSYEDAMSGIKILFNFAKENENLKLLGGIVDGKVVGPEVIQEYAKLPGREELLAKLLGSMNAPISGTVGLFSNLIAGFVRVIDGYKDTLPTEEKTEVKNEGGAAAEVEALAEEAKAEEVAETQAPATPESENPTQETEV